MGSPKALLQFEGETFLDRLIGAFSTECVTVTVVLGHSSQIIREGIARGGQVDFIVNPDPDRGQLSSLQCGLDALASDAEAILFSPVDYPKIRPATVLAVVAAFREQYRIVVPRYESKRGHPVLFAPELKREFLAVPAGGQARDVIHRYVKETRYVDVDDDGILGDIDDPLAYANLIHSAASR